MQILTFNKVVILACLGSILLTLFLKSRVHKNTDPQWYKTSALAESRQEAIPTITVHYHERRPYYAGNKGEVHGLVADPISQAFAYADIPVVWKETPAKRQLEIIQENTDYSCAAGWFKTPERERFAHYSLPVYQDRPLVAMARADNPLLGEKETLDHILGEKRLSLIVKAGYSYGALIDEMIAKYDPWRHTTTADNVSMLKMIQAHRGDYCFMAEEEAMDLLIYSGLPRSDFKLITLENLPSGNHRYIICSKQVGSELMARLNGALKYLHDIEVPRP